MDGTFQETKRCVISQHRNKDWSRRYKFKNRCRSRSSRPQLREPLAELKQHFWGKSKVAAAQVTGKVRWSVLLGMQLAGVEQNDRAEVAEHGSSKGCGWMSLFVILVDDFCDLLLLVADQSVRSKGSKQCKDNKDVKLGETNHKCSKARRQMS